MSQQAVFQSRASFLPDLCLPQAVFILVLVTELIVLVLVLADSGLQPFNWEQLAMGSMLGQWSSLSCAALLCKLRPWLHSLKVTHAAALSFMLVLSLISLFSLLGEYLLLYVQSAEWHSQSGWRVLNHTLIGSIIGGIILRYFYVQEQLRQQQQAELESRLEALQAKIRPHFLFNSMNSIASLIAVDPERAETIVVKFSELFRAALSGSQGMVPLAKELQLCRDYLAIEALRLGERLRVSWPEQIPDDIFVPSLLIQPLVENAVYHGIQPSVLGGEVALELALEPERVIVKISNPLPAESSSGFTGAGEISPVGHQIALENIRARLHSCYGESAHLSVSRFGDDNETDGATYTVEVSLPKHSLLE